MEIILSIFYLAVVALAVIITSMWFIVLYKKNHTHPVYGTIKRLSSETYLMVHKSGASILIDSVYSEVVNISVIYNGETRTIRHDRSRNITLLKTIRYQLFDNEIEKLVKRIGEKDEFSLLHGTDYDVNPYNRVDM